MKCPRCGSEMKLCKYVETIDGRKDVEYRLRCESCGYSWLIECVRITKSNGSVIITDLTAVRLGEIIGTTRLIKRFERGRKWEWLRRWAYSF